MQAGFDGLAGQFDRARRVRTFITSRCLANMRQRLGGYIRTGTGCLILATDVEVIIVIVRRCRCQIIFMYPGQNIVLLTSIIIVAVQILGRQRIIMHCPAGGWLGHVRAIGAITRDRADDIIGCARQRADIGSGDRLDRPDIISRAIGIRTLILRDIDGHGRAFTRLYPVFAIIIRRDCHHGFGKGDFGFAVSQRDFTRTNGDRFRKHLFIFEARCKSWW